MKGTNSCTELKFFCNPTPEFIIKGKLKKQIKDNSGKKLRDIPIIIIEYAIKGKIQNNFLAFSFPTHITKVFLPFDLSAS